MDDIYLPYRKVTCHVTDYIRMTYDPTNEKTEYIYIHIMLSTSVTKTYLFDKSDPVKAFIFFLNKYRIYISKRQKDKTNLEFTYVGFIDGRNQDIIIHDHNLLRPRYYDKVKRLVFYC